MNSTLPLIDCYPNCNLFFQVRCNGIRALGIFVKIITDVPTQGSETAILLDQAISIVAKQATVGNFMKVLWI